jgi:hypothetical protein
MRAHPTIIIRFSDGRASLHVRILRYFKIGMERTGTLYIVLYSVYSPERTGTFQIFFVNPLHYFRGAFFGKIMDSTEHAVTSGSLRTDQGGRSH